MLSRFERPIVLVAIVFILLFSETLDGKTLPKDDSPNNLEPGKHIFAGLQTKSGRMNKISIHPRKQSGPMGECFDLIAGKIFEERWLNYEKMMRAQKNGIPDGEHEKMRSDYLDLAYATIFPNPRNVAIADIRTLMG